MLKYFKCDKNVCITIQASLSAKPETLPRHVGVLRIKKAPWLIRDTFFIPQLSMNKLKKSKSLKRFFVRKKNFFLST
jgi:hypothetical protein